MITKRLFVALDLSSQAVAELKRIQPDPIAGVRPSAPEQLHLTLHFLGQAAVERAKVALQSVQAAEFFLTLAGVGQFVSREGASVLWVGLADCPPLHVLHRAVGTALSTIGFEPESRPYSPHITLARCKPGTPRHVTERFLNRHDDFKLPDQRITSFSLYSSEFVKQSPVYHCECSFKLTPPIVSEQNPA